MDEDTILRDLKAFFEVSSLRRIQRGHAQGLGSFDPRDTIAAHSHLVSWIAFLIALREGANADRAAVLGMMHDLPEARTGDHTHINKPYVIECESDVIADQARGLPTIFLERMNEYTVRESLESKIVKDADILAQLVLEVEYRSTGNRESERWIQSKTKERGLTTKTAKAMRQRIVDSLNTPEEIVPAVWWFDFGTYSKKKA
ncbi:MAG: HD domain-containing protein [bacterium]|nr:HD domain-containing protein [bacterium]